LYIDLYITMNISNFSNVRDLLPILNGAIITDLFVVYLLLSKSIRTKTLETWYRKFQLGAFMADVLSLVIGVIIARFVYTYLKLKWSLALFLLVVVIVQLIHDLSFYQFFSNMPRGLSTVLDVFSDYAKENGYIILFADAGMMISTVLIASILLSNVSVNLNIVLLIVLMYITPYFVYSV
jgi:uncharacterized protein YacL